MLSAKEQYKLFLNMIHNPKKGNNGGNPKSWLWFCGIENHPGSIADKHNNKLLYNAGYIRMENQDIQGFNSAILQILQELDLISDIQSADEMYDNKSALFYCMNLLPFAIDRHAGLDLDEVIFRLTGLPTVACYEHIATYMRSISSRWRQFSSSARVIVCFSSQPYYIYKCMDMFCRSGAEWDKMESQLSCAKENKAEVFSLTGDGITIIICPHPASRTHSLAKPEQWAEVVRLIKSAAADTVPIYLHGHNAS